MSSAIRPVHAAAWLLALLIVPALAGQQPVPAQSQADSAPAAYRMQAGDTVEIRFFYNPELNETMQIRPDGRVSLQLVGQVELAGKSVEETTALLESLYAHEVRTPKVTIQLRGFAAQKVYVTGEVMHPGALTLPGRLTVIEAINEAGGIKHTGSSSVAVLISKRADGLPEGHRLHLYDHGTLTADAGKVLSPFDVVLIPESRIARLDRWVDQTIRQLIPVNTSAGFTYLITKQGSSSIPIF